MKISADILAVNLKKKFAFTVGGTLNNELVLARPLFWSYTKEPKDDQIYMGKSGQIGRKPLKKVASILLYVGSPIEELSDIFETVLFFDENIDVFLLYNSVQEIYSEHEVLDFTLQDILNNGKGVQAMLDASEHIFQNPLLLHNSNMATIAYSVSTPDWLLDEDVLTEFTSNLKMNPEFNSSFDNQRATLFPAYLTGVRSMYVNIFDQDVFQYRLLVNETTRKFLPSDGPQLEYLAHFIKLALNSDVSVGYNEYKTLPAVLKGILAGSVTNLNYVRDQLSRNSWHVRHHYLCISVLLDTYDVQNHLIQNMTMSINRLIRGSCAFAFNKGICIYVNLDLFKGDNSDVISKLASFFRDNNLKAGVSNTFVGFNEIKLHFDQAELALNIGLRRRPTIWIHRYKDNVEDLLLESCVSKLPAKMLCAPELIRLREYDETNGTNYCFTLLTYLKNHMNKVQTAKDLYIHRSTFLYRLDRIQRLTGLDFEKSYKPWYMLLSFELLEMSMQK